MRVGLNATCFNDRPSGAKQRLQGLYSEFFKQQADTEFVIFEPRDCSVSSWFSQYSNVVGCATPVASGGRVRRFASGLCYWPAEFSKNSLDVFEAFHQPLIRPPTGKTLMTIHDIRSLYLGSAASRQISRRVLRDALRRSDHIITVSNTMRDEILDFYAGTPVSVVHNGWSEARWPAAGAEQCEIFRRKFELPQEFVLAVGHFEPRKNYGRLIRAFALLKQRRVDCPLIIIGNDSGERENVQRLASEMRVSDRFKILSDLSDDDVNCAYRSASLLVFPSTYEGFGIPIIEAMGASCPIVLSEIPAFRELAEGAGIFFSPESIEQMADSIEHALESPDLRSSLIAAGRRRVQDFKYSQLAGDLVRVYRSL